MATTTGTNVGSIELTTVSKATTTTNLTTSAAVSTVTVGESSYMYMRAKTITFTATGLKPNTRYYPFFNGVDVSAFCSAQDGAATSTITTNRLGDVTGNFFLPGNTFVAGSHIFELVDNVRVVSGANIPDPIYGRSEARYEANGVLKQQQTNITLNSTVTSNTVVTSVTTPTATVGGVQVPLATLLSQALNPPPVVLCNSWFFEYAVFNAGDTRVFTIATNTSTRPSDSAVRSAMYGAGGVSAPTYINTTRANATTWHHTYSARFYAGGSDSNVAIFRQEWTGPSTAIPPDLTNFRPSGLPSGAGVSITIPWTNAGSVACPVNQGYGAAAQISTGMSLRWDPLAQSFFVDPITYPQGIFATSVAVYFKRADQSTPAILEMREMANGLPGSNILPGGRVIVPGYSTAQSPDASVPTLFKFDQPVYLKSNTDYCFVLRSPSLGYEVWCSKLGEVDIQTQTVIDTQPFSGSMFLSENNYTWIPDSTQDIKFDLNIASFDTSVTGNVVFYPQVSPDAVPNYYGTSQTLPLSFIYTTKGSKVINIKIPMHGLQTGDAIFIEGIAEPTPSTAYNNLVAASLNGEFAVTVVDDDTVSVTTTGANTADKTGYLRVSDLLIGVDGTPPIIRPQVDPVVAIPFINNDNLSSSTLPGTVVTPTQPTLPALSSTESFRVYANVIVNELMVDAMTTEFDSTTIDETISISTGKSTAGSETPYQYQAAIPLPNADQFYQFDEPRMVATPSNETIHSTELDSNPSVAVNFSLESTNRYTSPVIDMNGMSLMTRTYRINNQVGELDATVASTAIVAGQAYTIASVGTTDFTAIGASSNTSGGCFIATGAGTGTGTAYLNSEVVSGRGNALAKYKSPVHTLETFHKSIKIFVTANCPSPAKIDAYIRTSTDRETHADQNWVWVPIQGVFGTSFINSVDRLSTNEWMYEVNLNEPFNVYDIKLVMRTTNNSVIPKIYSVRAITDII